MLGAGSIAERNYDRGCVGLNRVTAVEIVIIQAVVFLMEVSAVWGKGLILIPFCILLGDLLSVSSIWLSLPSSQFLRISFSVCCSVSFSSSLHPKGREEERSQQTVYCCVIFEQQIVESR